MAIKFSVKSQCFSLYKAFREEAEKAGWTYNTEFNSFEEFRMNSCNCLFFSTEWTFNGYNPKFAFSNSGYDNKSFTLPEQWNEAIEFMTRALTDKPKEKKMFTLSLKDLAAHHGVDVEDITIIA